MSPGRPGCYPSGLRDRVPEGGCGACLPWRVHVSIRLEPVLAAVRQMDTT